MDGETGMECAGEAKVLRWARVFQPLIPVGFGVRSYRNHSDGEGYGEAEDLQPERDGEGSGRGRGWGFLNGAGRGYGHYVGSDTGGGVSRGGY